MSARRLWLLGAVLCVGTGCPPSPTSTEGGLANGTFGYVCPNGPDNACDDVPSGTVPIPSSIAVGAQFSLLYTASSSTLNVQTSAPQSSTPSILGGTAGDFAFVAPGTAGVLVSGPGGVVDFLSVTGEDIAGVGAFNSVPGGTCLSSPPPAGDAGVPDAGGGGQAGTVANLGTVVLTPGSALDLNLEPIDPGGQMLAGAVPVQVTSSDDTVVSVGSVSGLGGLGGDFGADAHAFELCGTGLGTAVITRDVPGAGRFVPRDRGGAVSLAAASSAWVAALAALATSALTGCSSPGYDHLALDPTGVASAESGAVFSSPTVTLQEGLVVVVAAVPMSTDGPLGGDFTFDLASSDTSVLGVEPALGQPAGPAQFVFFGVGPGDAEIEITVNGAAEAPIPATVTAQ